MFIITHDVAVIRNAAAPTLSGEVFNQGGGASALSKSVINPPVSPDPGG